MLYFKLFPLSVKTIIFFYLLICLFGCGNLNTTTSTSSTIGIDSLQKYTYLLAGIYNGKPTGIASSFLTRFNAKLYIASCYHVFTCWETFNGGRETGCHDTILIRLINKNSQLPEFIPINISKISLDSPFHYYYDSPDIYFYELRDKEIEDKYYINTVNFTFNGEANTLIKPVTVLFWGFDFSDFRKSNDFITTNPKLFQGEMLGVLNQTWHYDDKNIEDTFNYQSLNPCTGGCSGSPVFLIYHTTSFGIIKDELFFGGVVIGKSNEGRNTLILKPQQFVTKSKFL